MRPTDAMCVPCGSEIAIALHTPPHRAISLALLAQALGATQGKGGLRRSISTLAEASPVSSFKENRITTALAALAEASTSSFTKGRTSSSNGTSSSPSNGRKKASPAMVLTAVEVEVSSTQDDV